MPQINKLRFRRGAKANLPIGGTEPGEPRYASDTQELFIDDGVNNVQVGGNPANFPVSTAQAAADTDSRARPNHTGTQPVSTLSDHTKAVHDALAIVPGDGSVTDAKVAAGAAIAEAKLNLASDALPATASRRTLGTGAQQAAAGSHRTQHEPGGADALTGFATVEEAVGDRRITVGEEVWPRENNTSTSIATVSQRLALTYFKARKTESITQVRWPTGGTAATAATLCRFGIYSVDASENLTLVASTVNDTTLFAATFSGYLRSLTSTFNKVRGARYAFGLLVVATGMPTFYGATAIPGLEPGAPTPPRLAGTVAGQADLPASIAAASVSNTGCFPMFGVILP